MYYGTKKAAHAAFYGYMAKISIAFNIVVQTLGRTVLAYPKGGGPNHQRGRLGIIKRIELGFQAGLAGPVAQVHAIHIACVADAQNQV